MIYFYFGVFVILTVSFLIPLFIFLFIGLLSTCKSKETTEDYFLATRSTNAWVVGLSVFATGNTGWMFIAQTSYSYLEGLSSMWLLICWPLGDFIASLFFYRKFMTVTKENKLISFGEVISNWNKEGKNYTLVRFFAGFAVVLFLGLYAAAQFKAGSKALHIIFGCEEAWGVLIGAIIVLAYCWSGGIRASIWTDVVQGIMMIVSMGVLLTFSILHLGGWNVFVDSLYAVSPDYMSLFKKDTLELGIFLGPLLFLLGWIFGGFGALGQPHIMARFMAMDARQSLWRARFIQYPSVLLFSALCVCTGLAARLIFPEQNFDTELVFPLLSLEILPQVLVGIMLAGVFSATMSTADSQVLSCSSSLLKDIFQVKKVTYFRSKLSTISVCLIVLALALYADESVFSIVLLAWAILAATFSPILVLYSIGEKLSQAAIFSVMLVSLVSCLLWSYWGFNSFIYQALPGILSGLLFYFLLYKTIFIK